MSTDDEILAAARVGFLEEARDYLSQFEHALLALGEDAGDAEAMNSAFRAAHTIKGSAGLFGFDALVAFTHEVESVLDAMRAGTLALAAERLELLLQSRDQMDLLLQEIDSGEPSDETAARSDELGTRLRALRGDSGSASRDPHAAKAQAASAAGDAGVWHLSVRMLPDALRNGIDPIPFIRYLERLGELVAVRCVEAALPDLAEIDPEACYLGYEIRLRTASDQAAIESAFEFLTEDGEMAVLPPDAEPQAYEALLARRAPAPAQRELLLAIWQDLAGPGAPPFVERRNSPAADRRQQPDRRQGDRRAGAGGGDANRFVRVRADKLDRLIDLIGELVIASSGAQVAAQAEDTSRFVEAVTRIHEIVQETRDGALGLRMVPINETFARFRRVVHDVGVQLGKEVELQISGGDTELDKSMVEVIADPLMHLVRNSLDHGLETAQERLAAGKPPVGRLGLHAYHESGSVLIEVSDDGRGLNRERIHARAVERGLIAADAVLEDAQVHALIFEPGFSTAEKVTNLSGRGVGMDVVKRNVESLRGSLRVATQPGQGATVQIRLPLTLAIIDGFLTSVGGVSYVLPLELVSECIELPQECQAGDRAPVAGHFDLRGEVVPYIDLARFFEQEPQHSGYRSLVVVRDGPQRVGLVVDRLLGQHQTVIKPLASVFEHIRGLAGSTILGSGEVALILDVPALLTLAIELQRRSDVDLPLSKET